MGLKDSFIKWAANCQRAVVSFAGKCRMVRRGVVSSSRMKKIKMLQIRIQIHKVHTERQEIHNYKNADTHKYKFHCRQSWPDQKRRKKWDFMKKVFSRNWPLLLFQNTFKSSQRAKTKLFSRAKYPQARAEEFPKNHYMGGKVVKSFKKFADDRIFSMWCWEKHE